MKRASVFVIGGFIIGIIILPLGAFLYIWLGYAPVATAASPLPLEKRLARAALHARIKREAPHQAAYPASDENLLAGAKVYQQDCAVCHGMKDQPKTPIAKGMFPPPPQLLRGKGVTDDPVGETYWKVANGIRLSGMPAFRESFSDLELWQVSQFLAKADQLPDKVTTYLKTQK